MRIDLTPITSLEHLTPASASKASFTELLDLPATATSQAASFSAFGMFGRRPAALADATPDRRHLPLQTPPHVRLESEKDTASRAIAAADVSATLVPGAQISSAPTSASIGRARRDDQTRLANQIDPMPGEVVAMVENHDEGTAAPMSGTRLAGRVRHPHSPAPTSGYVTLSASDGAAEVLVRASGLSENEIQQFRSRARDLLRANGLDLDKVSINGEDRTQSDAPQREPGPWR